MKPKGRWIDGSQGSVLRVGPFTGTVTYDKDGSFIAAFEQGRPTRCVILDTAKVLVENEARFLAKTILEAVGETPA